MRPLLLVGVAIAVALRDPEVWRSHWQLNDLFRPGRGGWLVAPGRNGAASGTSADYGVLRASGTAVQTRLRLSRSRRETQVVVLGKRVPTTVTIDGQVVSGSGSATALRRQRQGWLMHTGPFAGVVLKLAPRTGPSLVQLDYETAGPN